MSALELAWAQERGGAAPPRCPWASCPAEIVQAGLSFPTGFGNTLSLSVTGRTFQSLPLLCAGTAFSPLHGWADLPPGLEFQTGPGERGWLRPHDSGFCCGPPGPFPWTPWPSSGLSRAPSPQSLFLRAHKAAQSAPAPRLWPSSRRTLEVAWCLLLPGPLLCLSSPSGKRGGLSACQVRMCARGRGVCFLISIYRLSPISMGRAAGGNAGARLSLKPRTPPA